MKRLLSWIGTLSLLLLWLPAQSAEKPILQLDPGGHMALIRDIAFTPDGRTLVSASDDKTIRVWDWQAGRTERVLRGQIGPDDEGKLYAMALSPDGKRLALGGWMKFDDSNGFGDIRLYNLASGEVEGLLQGHSSVVLSLAFSPDGRQLVSGSADNTAIIWDVSSRQLLQRLKGHADRISAVAFSGDGRRIVTGSYDHLLKLWRVRDGSEIKTLQGHTDNVRSVAYAPDKDLIASGSKDHSIRLWDGHTGQFLRTLADQGTEVGLLSFSPDGRYLLSSDGYGKKNHCHVYEVSNGRELIRYSGHKESVFATAISPNGQWAATGGGNDHEIDIWDLRTGKRKQRLAGTGAPVWAVGFSGDGRRLLWGHTWKRSNPIDRGPLEYQLILPSDDAPLGNPEPYVSEVHARIERNGWSLTTQQDVSSDHHAVLEVRKDGRIQTKIVRHQSDGYGHRSYSFTPDGRTVISGGSNGVLSAYNLEGRKLGDYLGHTGDVWAVAVSPDGRFLASGADDETLRFWNIKTRELLLTLFHGRDGQWVAWTSSGHYAASPNGDRMVGWQLNRGPAQAAEYVKASQLRKQLYRPEIVTSALRLGNLQQALKASGLARFELNQQLSRPLPNFEIATPNPGTQVTDPLLPVRLAFAANPDRVDELQVFVNGRQVTGEVKQRGELAMPVSQQRFAKTLNLHLEPGENRILILARNGTGETRRGVTVILQQPPTASPQGDLYLIAIGVSDYPELGKGNRLHYADADARDFQAALTRQVGRVYRRVETRLLADGADWAPTKDNIEDALELFSQAGPDDTVVLFLAGHGTNEDREYFFLPQDAQRSDGRLRKSRVLNWLVFQNALQGAQGRRLMLVDTCHAGNSYNLRLVKDAADAQIVVISATNWTKPALELAKFGHGIFTYVLLQGLEGKADVYKDGKIMLKELDVYLSEEVERLSYGLQKPVTYSSGVEDFVLARYE